MDPFIYLREYVLFMHWFETSHQCLFLLYADKIGFPVDDKGIQLQYWMLDNRETTLLNNIIAAYYKSSATVKYPSH